MNWKDPVFQAMDINGNWEEDPDHISEFYDYSCEMPSGAVIERNARFFGPTAFRLAIARWNRAGDGKYKYFYDAMNKGSHGIPDPNVPKITSVGTIRDGKLVRKEARENANEAL